MCLFCIKAIFLTFFKKIFFSPVNEHRNTFLHYVLFYRPGFVNRTTRDIWEVLFFFQHFLQQYRRHRIHSFTNTKHTTTLAAAAAAVEGREGEEGGRGGTGDGDVAGLEVASSVSPSILSIIVRKNLPFGGCHFGTFLQHSRMRTMEKAFFWEM